MPRNNLNFTKWNLIQCMTFSVLSLLILYWLNVCYFGPCSIFYWYCKRTWYPFPNVYILEYYQESLHLRIDRHVWIFEEQHSITILQKSYNLACLCKINNVFQHVEKCLISWKSNGLIIKCLHVTVSYLFLMMNVRKRVTYTCWLCFLHESCIRFLWTLHWNS